MKVLLLVVVPLAVVATLAGLAIGFGGPGEPAPMASINDPFKNLDYSRMPALTRFAGSDGAALAYRAYPAAAPGHGSVVLIHGSSASSKSMHPMAGAFATAGYHAYALDIRGHGASGTKGRIDHVGQLEDDLAAFMLAVKPAAPVTLAGFSSGGGFALRFAGSARQTLFANYLLLSPFISPQSPTQRPGSGGWVSVGVPRLVAIAALNRLGVTAFNALPVTRFALNPEAQALLTPSYSFALALNFGPLRDYRANIRAAMQPMALIAGRDDEAFHADRFAALFESESRDVPVTLLPGIGHIALTLDPLALQAAVAAVVRMNRPRP